MWNTIKYFIKAIRWTGEDSVYGTCWLLLVFGSKQQPWGALDRFSIFLPDFGFSNYVVHCCLHGSGDLTGSVLPNRVKGKRKKKERKENENKLRNKYFFAWLAVRKTFIRLSVATRQFRRISADCYYLWLVSKEDLWGPMATLWETQAVLCYMINGCSRNYNQHFYLLEENIYILDACV